MFSKFDAVINKAAMSIHVYIKNKRNTLLAHAATWMNLKCVMLSKRIGT